MTDKEEYKPPQIVGWEYRGKPCATFNWNGAIGGVKFAAPVFATVLEKDNEILFPPGKEGFIKLHEILTNNAKWIESHIAECDLASPLILKGYKAGEEFLVMTVVSTRPETVLESAFSIQGDGMDNFIKNLHTEGEVIHGYFAIIHPVSVTHYRVHKFLETLR